MFLLLSGFEADEGFYPNSFVGCFQYKQGLQVEIRSGSKRKVILSSADYGCSFIDSASRASYKLYVEREIAKKLFVAYKKCLKKEGMSFLGDVRVRKKENNRHKEAGTNNAELVHEVSNISCRQRDSL